MNALWLVAVGVMSFWMGWRAARKGRGSEAMIHFYNNAPQDVREVLDRELNRQLRTLMPSKKEQR